MPLVVTAPSRTLTSLLFGPRILAGLHFRPSPRHLPEFLSHAEGRTPARLLSASFVGPLRIAPGTVRRAVRDFLPETGTLVLQRGRWEPANGDAARFVLENRGGRPRSAAEFRAGVDRLVCFIMGKFRPERIWVDFYRGARRVSARQYLWRHSAPPRS